MKRRSFTRHPLLWVMLASSAVVANVTSAPARGPVVRAGVAQATLSATAAPQVPSYAQSFVQPGYQVEVVTLRAAMPNAAAGSASTTTSDVASTVMASLSAVAPDLRLTPVPNLPQIVVAGSPASVKLAKDLIERLDQPQKLVILDTQILEINETVAKNLGLSFAPNTVVSTTYSETTPQPNAAGNAIPLLGLQPLSRTPLQLQFQLGLAISQGKGRVLADPRITTVSGKTASIRAGDNITVLTQAGGGTGVAVTTQLQTFNTGVSLDITPIVNANGYVTINLHPVVNNVSSISSAGIPQISTRDTQTTVGIREGQTLVIGGLIQENATRTTTKIPLLGDLPLIGPAFRNEQVNNSSDELIIMITPHVVDPMQAGAMIVQPPPVAFPTPAAHGAFPGATFPPMPGSDGAVVATPSLPPIYVYNVVAGPGLPVAAALGFPPGAAPTPAPGAFVPQGPLGALPFGLPSALPQASPSAFAATNVFTYGAAPANNYAAPGDPVQIFFATLSPTVLHGGTTVNVSAVTTSNVATVTLGFGNATTTLQSVGPGKWQTSYTFSGTGVPSNQPAVQLTMTAARADGTSANISIPVTYTP